MAINGEAESSAWLCPAAVDSLTIPTNSRRDSCPNTPIPIRDPGSSFSVLYLECLQPCIKWRRHCSTQSFKTSWYRRYFSPSFVLQLLRRISTLYPDPPLTAHTMARTAIVYAVDWAVIIATIGFAGSLSFWATPATRPFSISDPSIAFPFQTKTKISTGLLLGLAVLFPIVLLLVLCLFVPTASTPSGAGWRRKIYAANKAVLGLGLSIALALLFTDSIKNLLGKPRPDMLSRCQPIIDRRQLPQGSTIGEGLFTWNICSTKAESGLVSSDLRDGFRSFPSGHASSTFSHVLLAPSRILT